MKLGKAIFAGLVSGLLLSFFFKAVQHWTGEKVYTLLLNVDYIPIINRYQYSEAVEVGFHLIVSVALCVLLALLYGRAGLNTRRRIVICTLIVNIGIGLLLFLTTAFSDRTPNITSITSLTWWLIGHAIYGAVAGFLLGRRKK